MTSELRPSALIATIDLIENSRNTQEFMTIYMYMEIDVKMQKSQTKAITNHTGTTNYKGVTEHYKGKRKILLLVTGIKRTSHLDLLSDRNTHKDEALKPAERAY